MTLMQDPSTCTHPDFRDPQGAEKPGKYCCACGKRFCVLVPEFIRRTQAADPARHVKTDLIIDTNVKAEIYTLGDLCQMIDEFDSLEACLASPAFRYRQRRTKHSIILAWWLAQNRVSTGYLGAEGLQIVTEKLAPETHAFSFMMTTAIVHIILPLVMEGWPIGSLVEVDHLATGTAADSEILRVAKDENLPVMTWEAFNTDGTFSSNPQKLRNRCHEVVHTSVADGMDGVAALLAAMRHAMIDLDNRYFNACSEPLPYVDAIPRAYFDDMRNAGAGGLSTC